MSELRKFENYIFFFFIFLIIFTLSFSKVIETDNKNATLSKKKIKNINWRKMKKCIKRFVTPSTAKFLCNLFSKVIKSPKKAFFS